VSTLCEFSDIQRELCIETGTGGGDTLALACRSFPCCVSVERNVEQYWRTVERFTTIPNVKLFFDDSPEFLRRFLQHFRRFQDGATYPEQPTFPLSVTFWLDAHTSDRSVANQCPLMDELGVITSTKWATLPIILIDDAHFFDASIQCCPGKSWRSCGCDPNFKHEQFPTVEQIDQALPGYRRSMRPCQCQERFRGPDIIQYTPV
jgi:hypothetical protein